ncbi:MAG: hypothetical protein ACOYOU_00855 [Kiritimatiellia bacterium]
MKKTPKVVREALLSGSVHTVGGIQLREVTLSTLLILEEINSPLVDEQAKTRKDPMKNMDLMRAIYVFSKHPREAFATFRLGQAAFDAAAIELGASISVPDTKAIGEKMAELIARATSTIVSAEKKTTTPLTTPPTQTV